MANTETSFELLDSNRYDDPPMEDAEQTDRERVAAVLRGLRHQPRCQVTADLLREWKRRADELQCYRRIDALNGVAR